MIIPGSSREGLTVVAIVGVYRVCADYVGRLSGCPLDLLCPSKPGQAHQMQSCSGRIVRLGPWRVHPNASVLHLNLPMPLGNRARPHLVDLAGIEPASAPIVQKRRLPASRGLWMPSTRSPSFPARVNPSFRAVRRVGSVTRQPGPTRAPRTPGTSGRSRNDPCHSHLDCPAGPAW